VGVSPHLSQALTGMSDSGVVMPLRCLATLMLDSLREGCSPIEVLNRRAPQHTHRREADIAYGEHPRQRLDLYLPAHATATAAPVVLFFYGGSWQSGERAQYRFVGEALAGRGIVTAVADYRLFPEVRYSGFLHDSALALAWLRTRVADHGGDPDRLVVAGHSAGAFNAAMLALDARWLGAVGLHPDATVAGLVGIAGPYDFRPLIERNLMAIFNPPETPETTPDDTQPIVYASASAPPALLVAPREDHIVYPGVNTGGLSARLRQLGVAVTERYYASANHYTIIGAMGVPLRPIAPVLEDVAGFVHALPSRPLD